MSVFPLTEEGLEAAILEASRLSVLNDMSQVVAVMKADPEGYSITCGTMVWKDDVDVEHQSFMIGSDGQASPAFPGDDGFCLSL